MFLEVGDIIENTYTTSQIAKIIGIHPKYFLYSLVSLLTLFVVAKVFFGFEMQGSILQFILGWILVTVSMFSIGMMVGGIAKNTKVAGIIASILYLPMNNVLLPIIAMPVIAIVCSFVAIRFFRWE